MENQEEIWKDVIGYEGLYQVSDSGKVKSLGRIICRSNGTFQKFKERLLSIHISSNGYPSVGLSINGNSRMFNVHSLIAKSFIDKNYIIKNLVVNHKDGIKLNSILSNLEVVSYSCNLTHAHKNRLNTNFAETHNFAKHSNEDINKIKELIRNGLGNTEISKYVNTTPRYIGEIRRGKKRVNG
jgi:hypothetical protein